MQSIGEGPFDCIAWIGKCCNFFLRQCLEIGSMEVKLFVLDKLSGSADFVVKKNFCQL